jgi:hypothetical protein
MVAPQSASSGARAATKRLCASASPLRSRSMASSTRIVVRLARAPVSATNSSSLSVMVPTARG